MVNYSESKKTIFSYILFDISSEPVMEAETATPRLYRRVVAIVAIVCARSAFPNALGWVQVGNYTLFAQQEYFFCSSVPRPALTLIVLQVVCTLDVMLASATP
jgi:hypothetical protein